MKRACTELMHATSLTRKARSEASRNLPRIGIANRWTEIIAVHAAKGYSRLATEHWHLECWPVLMASQSISDAFDLAAMHCMRANT